MKRKRRDVDPITMTDADGGDQGRPASKKATRNSYWGMSTEKHQRSGSDRRIEIRTGSFRLRNRKNRKSPTGVTSKGSGGRLSKSIDSVLGSQVNKGRREREESKSERIRGGGESRRS